jgi:hypothetical protein
MPGPIAPDHRWRAPGRHIDCRLDGADVTAGIAVPGHGRGTAVPVTRSRQTETPGPRDRAAAKMAGRHPSAAPSTHAQRGGCTAECRLGVGHSAARGPPGGAAGGVCSGRSVPRRHRPPIAPRALRAPVSAVHCQPAADPTSRPRPSATHRRDPAVSPSVPAARPGRPLPAPPPGRPGRRWNRGRRSSRTGRSSAPRRPARCAG